MSNKAGLCHMLLDAIRQLGQVWTSKYPLALALCGCGFFGVMFAERICAPQQHQSQEQRECVEIENGSYHAVQRVEPQKNSETDSLLYKPIRGREPGSPAKPLVSSIVLTVALRFGCLN
ncbi:hypothetical protein Pelo_1331 [Pelomyxa schiedti]|nr:hypothetical protein Pelo_1331 [Pelomyxa schiedti]